MPTTGQIENQELTLDHILLKDPQFFKIKELLLKLDSSGVLQNMQGNCISACETMQHLLFQIGIESEIRECQLVVTRDGTQQANDVLFIGFDDRHYAGEIDTHVVLLTKSKVPLLIDLSLGHVLPKDHSYLIERLNENNNELGTYVVGNLTLSYAHKTNIKLHTINQKNLLSRFLAEQEKIKKIGYIEKIAYWALIISGVDLVVNTIILCIKLINDIHIFG